MEDSSGANQLCVSNRSSHGIGWQTWIARDHCVTIDFSRPSLAGVCRSCNLRVSEKVLVRVAQTWHTHSIRLAAHIWAEFKRHLRSQSFHSPFDVPHIDLPEHLSYLM